MNKKFFTLVALLGLFVSFGASAQSQSLFDSTNTFPIVSGNYYYLKTSELDANYSGYLSIKQKTDSLVIYEVEEGVDGVYTYLKAAGDSALWSVAYVQNAATGKYVYTIKNKVSGQQLSFNTAGVTQSGNSRYSVKATLGGSNDLVGNVNPKSATYVGALPFYYFNSAQDSTLQLRVVNQTADSQGVRPVGFVKTKNLNTTGDPSMLAQSHLNTPVGTATDGVINFTFLKPAMRNMTVKELNSLQGGNGFIMSAFFNGVLTDHNIPLMGKTFLAEPKTPATGDADTQIYVKDLRNPVKNGNNVLQHFYAVVDTIPYNPSVALTDGSGMTFDVDTIAVTTPKLTKSYYTFTIDPSFSNPYDSVIVKVYNSYQTTAPFAAVAGTFPMQVNQLNAMDKEDGYILTTGAAAAEPNKQTRIVLKGGTIPEGKLAINKVYQVKVLSQTTLPTLYADVDEANIAIVNLANKAAMSNKSYAHVPATQFVFDGETTLKNRENADVKYSGLYYIAADSFATVYGDTLEITAMAVDAKDKTVGYARFEDYKTKAYTMDYVDALLTGLSISINDDSLVRASESPLTFKFVPKGAVEKFGPVVDKGVVQLERQAYYIMSSDNKSIVEYHNPVKGVSSQFVLKDTLGRGITSNAATVYFREVENKGTYILVEGRPGDCYELKGNINSTTALLEAVNVLYGNNAVAINYEFDAPYKRDGAGHKKFESSDVIGALSADSSMFAVVKREGDDVLKATYSEDDFKLYVDTAKVKGTEAAPFYYILKGAKITGDTLAGNFLRVMSDSLAKNNKNYFINVDGTNRARMQFVAAKTLRSVGGDSLLIGNATKFTKDKASQFQFKMKFTSKTSTDLVKFENFKADGVTSNGFLAYQNGVVYLTNDEAAALKLGFEETGAPTSNEGAQPESGVKVYVADGAVIVQGAAGKVVTINNVLGQTVVNATAASDYESFAVTGMLIVKVGADVFKVSVQ